MPFLTVGDFRPAVLAAFVSPPAGVCLAWLSTRIAIHYSLWGAVPLFMLAVVVGAAVCLLLAGWFAARQTGWWIAPRFAAWVVASVACVAAGLALVELLPISVGDGP